MAFTSLQFNGKELCICVVTSLSFSWYKKTQFSLDLVTDWTHFTLLLALFGMSLIRFLLTKYCRKILPEGLKFVLDLS